MKKCHCCGIVVPRCVNVGKIRSVCASCARNELLRIFPVCRPKDIMFVGNTIEIIGISKEE